MVKQVVERLRAWLRTSESTFARWVRAARDALLGEMPILAAGTALFTIFSIVPTLAATVAIYGVVADPKTIEHHLGGLTQVLPGQVAHFLRSQFARQADQSSSELGIALAVTVIIAVFSARGASHALVDSLNRAYRVREQRKFLHKLGLTIAMSAVSVGGILVMLFLSVALPTIATMFGLDGWKTYEWLRWLALVALVFGALLLLYRYAPSPRPLGTERHLWPGAAAGTVLLLAVSFGLSFWVTHGANTGRWYGTFGSALVVLVWFYLATLALVIGGFVNAELERHSGAPQPDRSLD